MHRSTGANTLHRAYASGGSRHLVDKVEDKSLMQTTEGSAMKGEVRKDVEAPQNYGFTSVVADATKGKDGQIEQCAEGFMSYLGGNRSLPVCGVMDDRRHRLKDLAKDAAKGAVAVFGQKEWGQQYLNTKDGQFITGNKEKKNRMQLVENQNGKKQQTSGSQAGGKSAGAQSASTQSASARKELPRVTPYDVFRNALGYLAFRTKSGVEFEIEEIEVEQFDVGVSTLADGGSGGSGAPAGGAGGQQSQGSSKPTGQKSLHKEESDIAVEQNGKETYSQHGKFYTAQKSGSDASMYHEDRKKSHQVTDEHLHMRYKDNWYWSDETGNYFIPPPLVKKDPHCKE